MHIKNINMQLLSINQLKNNVHKLAQSGFLYVFFANMFSYMVTFCATISYSRLLTPNDFGVFSFCYSIITFCLLLNGLGASSGVLQFISKLERSQEQTAYLKFAMRLGMGFNLLISIGIIFYAYFTTIPIRNAKYILLLMAFFPIGRLYIDVFQAYLRAIHKNILLAKFSFINNSILLGLNICGIIYHQLIGLIVGTYLSYFIIIIISIYIFKLPNIFNDNDVGNSPHNKKEFVTFSIYATIGNAFIGLMFNLDIIILSYIIKDTIVVANYKIATIIPFAINIIPGIIISFFYPQLAKNSHNIHYMNALKNKIIKLMLTITIPSSTILIIFAKPFINLLFGGNFNLSIIPFQILIFGFSFAALRIAYGNILAIFGRVKFAMWLNLIIAILNVIMSYILIKCFGIIGAAIGIVLIYIIASFCANLSLKACLREI